MEIGEYGIKCTDDIREAIKEYCGDKWDAAEILKGACHSYGDRILGMVCELAAEAILTPKDKRKTNE